MYQRALQGYEKAWGPDHRWTLNTVNNLAALYADQGKLVEAKQMYQRALRGIEKIWGLEHMSTLSTVNNLSVLYCDQGKLAEAEQMYQRVLQGYEKVVGPDHPRSQNLRDKLVTLEAIIRDKALAVVEDSERPSHLCGKETPIEVKTHQEE